MHSKSISCLFDRARKNELASVVPGQAPKRTPVTLLN
jgi:hypothetical protein